MIIKILEIIKKVLHSNHKKFHNLFYNNLSKMFLCLKIVLLIVNVWSIVSVSTFIGSELSIFIMWKITIIIWIKKHAIIYLLVFLISVTIEYPLFLILIIILMHISQLNISYSTSQRILQRILRFKIIKNKSIIIIRLVMIWISFLLLRSNFYFFLKITF